MKKHFTITLILLLILTISTLKDIQLKKEVIETLKGISKSLNNTTEIQQRSLDLIEEL
jgi:hypothetical protein